MSYTSPLEESPLAALMVAASLAHRRQSRLEPNQRATDVAPELPPNRMIQSLRNLLTPR